MSAEFITPTLEEAESFYHYVYVGVSERWLGAGRSDQVRVRQRGIHLQYLDNTCDATVSGAVRAGQGGRFNRPSENVEARFAPMIAPTSIFPTMPLSVSDVAKAAAASPVLRRQYQSARTARRAKSRFCALEKASSRNSSSGYNCNPR